MMEIVNRARKAGYISKRYGDYIPEKKRLASADFSDLAVEQERKYKKVLKEFLEYCKEKYNEPVSEREAEDVFVSFLKEHDLDILFMSQNRETLLPETTASPAHKFLINSFITNAHESEPTVFGFIVDISIGHVIANTLLCRYFKEHQGDLSECNFYLDIQFLFSILGINGNEIREAFLPGEARGFRRWG